MSYIYIYIYNISRLRVKLAAISVIEIDFFSSFVELKTRSRVLLVIHTADGASKIASHSEFTLQNAWECEKKTQNKHGVCIVTPLASNKHPLSTPERITLHETKNF
jgi:hypothetical protein